MIHSKYVWWLLIIAISTDIIDAQTSSALSHFLEYDYDEQKNFAEPTENVLKPQEEISRRAHTVKFRRMDAKHSVLFTAPSKTGLLKETFCGGNVIAIRKILTSMNCFYTRSKKLKIPLEFMDVVTYSNDTMIDMATLDVAYYKHTVEFIYYHDLFMFPTYNLAIARTGGDILIGVTYWHTKISQLPTVNSEFTGLCRVIITKFNTFDTRYRELYIENTPIITQLDCSTRLLRNMHEFYCTCSEPQNVGLVLEGSGLVCYRTTDPVEVDKELGLLLGVTTMAYGGGTNGLVLHTRVFLHQDWINHIISLP